MERRSFNHKERKEHKETTEGKTERKFMSDQFDELANGLAQSVTRRGALKKLGAGLTDCWFWARGRPGKWFAQPTRPAAESVQGKAAGAPGSCSLADTLAERP